MTSDEILAALVRRYPGLLPWEEYQVLRGEEAGLVQELTTLVGCWDQADNHMPVKCGHPACRARWVGTGKRDCVGEVPDEI